MIVNKQNLNSIYVNVKAIFTKRAEEATPLYPQISTKISSSTKRLIILSWGIFRVCVNGLVSE